MTDRASKGEVFDGPVGLDDRPRPASSRARVIKGLKQSAPFSSLQRRIIFFNLLGLTVLVAGMTYLSDKRNQLVDVYVGALRKHGEIIAASIAESALADQGGRLTLAPDDAAQGLAHLAPATGGRIRLYDLDGRLIADSYNLGHRSPPIESRDLPPPQHSGGSSIVGAWDWIYDQLNTLGESPPLYREVTPEGISPDEEVFRALAGQIASSARMNSQGELVVSVAIPVRRLHAILGVLRLSNDGGEVERFLREERKAVIQVFLLAALVSVLLSIVLANMIAAPIRQLADAVRTGGVSANRPLDPDKPQIPDLTGRADEIGELSDALIRMTGALYTRIGAIESFAADVAHEIKNPLTSLRSAVETMPHAKTEEQQQRLLDVIQNDVRRMDRLLTDISNASRLDAELVRERMEPVDLGKLILALADVTRQQADGLDVSVATDLQDGPLMTLGLEGRLAQVITNLLSNALSFSPPGGTIRVTGLLEDEMVQLSIEDDGPGIPPENLGSIFERFYSERPDSEAFGGHSGLGLSISRQIIEAHGGRIWAQNRTDGTSACFRVELPG